MRTDIFCRVQPWDDNVDVVVRTKHEDGRRFVALPVVMKEMHPDDVVLEPTLRMNPTEAQRLMDELWKCGLRPSEGKGSAGSLAATERHLKDMQTIALGLLKQHGVQP
jgi:hypothetical protein